MEKCSEGSKAQPSGILVRNRVVRLTNHQGRLPRFATGPDHVIRPPDAGKPVEQRIELNRIDSGVPNGTGSCPPPDLNSRQSRASVDGSNSEI